MFVEGFIKDGAMEPTEMILSNREAVITTKNSIMLKKYKDIIKKTGLELDLKEYFELFNEAGKEIAKDFGFDMIIHIEDDNTTIMKIKLLK